VSTSEQPLLTRAIPTLRVASANAALPLYRALGFSVAWEHQLAPDAPRLVCVSQSGVEVFLTEHPVTEAGAVAYFITRDVDAVVLAAREAGVVPTFGPEDRPWGNREAYFVDRDGNTLRFGELRSR
jgi:catechol 2,3-dioxygenase-like lactoylglutathione lyase family enzyme